MGSVMCINHNLNLSHFDFGSGGGRGSGTELLVESTAIISYIMSKEQNQCFISRDSMFNMCDINFTSPNVFSDKIEPHVQKIRSQ